MKQAYMRTLEVFLAFVMTFSFLIWILSSNNQAGLPENPQIYVLQNFEQRPDFRSCVFESNTTCIQELVDPAIPQAYDYQITINDASFTKEENLFVDAIYLTGSTASQQYIIRLYYWEQR